jgi:GWxTD domain-containing protein
MIVNHGIGGRWLYIIVITIMFFHWSCSTSKLGSENMNSRFSYGSDVINPEYALFHHSPDSSTLYFRIPEDALLFKNNVDHFEAGLKILWSVYPSYRSSVVVDSGSVEFSVRQSADIKPLNASFRLPMKREKGYVLRLEFVDLYRSVSAIRYLPLMEKGTISQQDFLLTDTSGIPLCRNIVRENESVKLVSGFPNEINWQVRCYFRNFPLAYLPFRVIDDPVFDMAADSFYTWKNDGSSALKLPRPGIYFFQTDTHSLRGFTLMCFDHEFPFVTKTKQLIEATRYLTTRKEYEQLKGSADQKAAIDKFWVEIGGNYERARGLIRAYYNRVQEANRLYTSYLEGWKTDRGMVHLIFGRPQSIYRDQETEQWSYANMPGFPDLMFVFRKMNNPFTDNDYALIRQPQYENVWYMAVDQWRQGRIVNDN